MSAPSSPPPPFPLNNSNFLEPCFSGDASLSSSAAVPLNFVSQNGVIPGANPPYIHSLELFGSTLASYPVYIALKKEIINVELSVSASLNCSLTGSNIFLPLNLKFQNGFIPNLSPPYTHSLELNYLACSLTGSTEASLCTSFYGGPQP